MLMEMGVTLGPLAMFCTFVKIARESCCIVQLLVNRNVLIVSVDTATPLLNKVYNLLLLIVNNNITPRPVYHDSTQAILNNIVK